MKPNPGRIDVEALAVLLSTTPSELRSVATHASEFYRNRTLLRRGKRRTLSIPTGKLKLLQSRLGRRVLGEIPPHDAAFCHKGRGALAAARLHIGHPCLLQHDIADFFPSVTTGHVQATLARLGFPASTRKILTDLISHDGRLPQGAPTSVATANLVLWRLDQRMHGLARKHGLTYTRYVDDLAMSGGIRVAGLNKLIERIVRGEGWSLNSKGTVTGPTEQHRFLGLIVNTKPNVSPTYVADIRSLLRVLRSSRLELSSHDLNRIRGRISYVFSVNSKVGGRLRGELDEVVSQLETH
jgi:hypothetical protein